jgi:VCBS repeat-containing protein
MTKPRRSLLSRTLQNLRNSWQRRPKRDEALGRRPRFEFLESRQMMHGGHDHGAGEGEDPNYDPNTNFHIHYQLDIVVNGDQQLIPAGVGNNVGANSGKFHTHDFSGKIHVHPGPLGRFATLNDFFESWRNDTVLGNTNATFSSTSILGNVANGTHTVRMYVNGTLNTDFQNYEFHDEDKIVISYEPIANTDFPSFEPIANQTLPAGAPLWLALDGLDPNGGPITYSVSVANPGSNPNLVTATIPTGNRRMVIDVEGFGKMTFELADDLTPDVVNKIVALINSGFYNRTVLNQTVQSSPAATNTAFSGSSSLSASNDFYNGQEVLFTSGALQGQRRRILDYVGATRQFTFATGFTAAPAAGDSFQVIREITFHRVVPNFVIQAGDPTATGAGGSGQPDFDDQFNLDLQFTSPGLLAMAKSSDDTNDSQWFVTDSTPRFLDFNHSIFGRLIDGEEIRDAINSVATTSDKPNTPVVINSIQVVTDTENASLRLKAAQGASGEADVTVTATDGQGHAFSRTFHVTVTPDEVEQVVVQNSPAPTATSFAGGSTLSSVNDFYNGQEVTFTSGSRNGQRARIVDYIGSTRTFVFNSGSFTGAPAVGDTFRIGSNSAPFLVNPTNVRGVMGQAIQLQLQAVDAEGNPNFFDAAKPAGETVNYTVNVNNNTGLVTITPPATFVGTFNVVVGVRGATSTTTNDQFDTQTVQVTVAPAAPTGIDLLAASDSGDSNSDNITNAGTLQFTISGVTSGALVKLMKGTNVLAQGTATGTTINLSTTNLGPLGDGVHGLTATQTISNVESAPSSALNVTLDTTAPAAFTSTPPTEADVNVLLTYDAQNPGEGTAGFKYQLVTPPAGVTINPSTGVLTWTPASAQLGLRSFGISAVDAAGNIRTQTLNITVDEAIPPKAEFVLRLIDANGNELTSLATGQDFFLQVFARDLEVPAAGVFSGYLDVQWDGTKATATGPLQYASPFGGSPSGSTATPGLLDEAGAVAGLIPTGPGLKEIFRLPMRATSGGDLLFSADPADVLPLHETSIFGEDDALPTEEIRYGSASITINATFNAVNDTFNFNEDSQNNTVTPLANDTNVGSATNVLTISAVGSTSNGGSVTIATDGKTLRYTPAANFFGTETFTYTARNQNNETATATVTIQVQPQNDAPTAVNDSLNVERNTTANVLDILANDLIAPDANETLRVTAIGAGSQGGTITIGNNGANVRYTPKANFTGTETFTYTISDRASGGLISQGTVTVNVTSTNPTAVNDTATATEDATTPIEINVLANDLLGDGTALTITAVGTPSQGGSVSITQNGTRINYTPAANKQGTETFTYTVSNGIGSATGTVTVTITNSNDAPTAVADTVTGFKNSTTTFDLLANDTSAPDPTENLVIDTVTQPANGTVQITENGKKVSFTPANNFTGTTTFTYTIKDPGNLTAGPVTVTVNVQEFTPSSLAGAVYFDGNNDGIRGSSEIGIGGVTITLTGTDINNAAVNRTVETAVDGTYKFDSLLPGNYTVAETHPAFTIDGRESAGTSGGTTTTNERIVVSNLAQGTNATGYNFGERGRQTSFVNDQGKTVSLVSIRDFFTSNFRRESVIVAVNSSGAELWHSTRGPSWEDLSSLSFAVQSSPSQIRIDALNDQSQPLTAALPVTNSQVRLIGTQNGNQLYQLQVSPDTLAFQNVNRAPTANPDTFTTGEDAPLNIAAPGLLSNDVDPDDNTLTAAVVTQPAHGSVTINSNGSFTYTPAANYNGPDSFTYRANDGTTTSQPVTVSLTVTAANDAPVAGNDTFTTPFNTALTPAVPGVLSNDTDVDSGATFTPTVVDQPQHGSVTMNANGSFTYTPTTGYSGPDSFTYRVNDGTVNSNTATVNITVQGEGEGEASDAALMSLLGSEDEPPASSTADDWGDAVDQALSELS